MRGFRITPLIISIVGVLLCIGAATSIYFLMIVPSQQQAATAQNAYAAVQQYDDPTLVPKAQKALDDANAQVKQVTDKWNYVLANRNPKLDVSDRFNAWKQWINECEYDFAPRVNKFLATSGVQATANVVPPAPPSDPNAVPTTVADYPLGTVTVFGSYEQILNHMSRWNSFDRIVMVDGLALNGYSPFMTGSYTATEYIFPQNNDKVGNPLPSAAGGAAPGGGGSGMAGIRGLPPGIMGGRRF